MAQALSKSHTEDRFGRAATAGCGCAKCRRRRELEAIIEPNLSDGLDEFLPVFIKRDISASVGRGGVNRKEDVRSIQLLLNTFIAAQRLSRRTLLRRDNVVDGVVDADTVSAIKDFQLTFVGMRIPDGRVNLGRDTLKKLNGPVNQSQAPVKPIPEVSVLMPNSSPGLYTKKEQWQRYGLRETIEALKKIGLTWSKAHPAGPRVRIGDISMRGGGEFPPHKSHRMGIDVDIAIMRNDGKEELVNFKTHSRLYSRPLTQELVNAIRGNGILRVHRLFFADRGVTNVNHDNIHNKHLHVRFCVPSKYNLKAMISDSDTSAPYVSCD
jgi:hypothetical protein